MAEQYNFDSELKVDVDEDGFLSGKAVISSAVVSTYNKDGKISKEFKAPEYLFSKQTMDSAKLKPITNEHPDLIYDPEGRVTSKNYKKLTVGTTGESVERVGDDLVINFSIHDHNTIEEIRSGKTGVSIGYKSTILEKSGEYKGEKYSSINSDIRINHLALTSIPRVENARLNLDSSIDDDNLNNLNNSDMTETIDNSEILKELEEYKKRVIDLEAKYDSAQDELASYKNKECETQRNDSLSQEVNERVKTILEVKDYLKDKTLEVLTNSSPIELKSMVLRETFNVDSEKLTNDSYILARYDSMTERFQADSLKTEEVLKASKDIQPTTIKTKSRQELYNQRIKR